MFWSCRLEFQPRLQGDIGELSALAWLADQGADVFVPIGHSRDVDLIAIFGEHLLRVQVKTSTVVVLSNRRYEVTLATRGWQPELEWARQALQLEAL